MKLSDTISVDPGKITLGAKNNELNAGIFRVNVLTDRKEEDSILRLTSLVFPAVNSGSKLLNKYCLPLRTLFSALLIISGLAMLGLSTTTLPINIGIGVVAIAIGGMLALGLFTKIASAGGALFFGIMGAISLRAGTVNMEVFMLMFGCLLFLVVGAGKYSCDTILRSHIIKKRKETLQKHGELSYKSFRYSMRH